MSFKAGTYPVGWGVMFDGSHHKPLLTTSKNDHISFFINVFQSICRRMRLFRKNTFGLRKILLKDFSTNLFFLQCFNDGCVTTNLYRAEYKRTGTLIDQAEWGGFNYALAKHKIMCLKNNTLFWGRRCNHTVYRAGGVMKLGA